MLAIKRPRQRLAALVALLLAMPLPAVADQLVFVTSSATTSGNLGGLAGGDAICAAAAASASLAGKWVAWLSNAGINAADRVIGNGPFRRIDNVQIALNRAALLDGTLDAPISIDENGNPVSIMTSSVWTGTFSDGGRSGSTCLGWTGGDGLGTSGRLDRTDSLWTNAASSGCHNSGVRLYCFQQGQATAAHAPLLGIGALAVVALALLLGGWLALRRRA